MFVMLAVLGIGGLASALAGSYSGSKHIAMLFSAAALLIASYMVFEALEVPGFLGSTESLPYIGQFGIYLSFTATQFGVVLVLLASIVSLAASVAVSTKFENTKNL